MEYIVSKDADSNALTGKKNYLFHLPPDIPAIEYWSVLVYDKQTKLIIKNDQSWPSVFSTSKKLVFNQDGSIDVRFGPTAPNGKENNWIQTIPGNDFTIILRLYGTLESWFDQTWKPGDVVFEKNQKNIFFRI